MIDCSGPSFRKLIPLLALLLLGGALAPTATAQQAQNQANTASQKPVSLSHLYWHFLIHQNQLDEAAARLQAKGGNGNAVRNSLQNQLGFSDADYASIRTSSQRLASELKPLDERLHTLQQSPASGAQARNLIDQREALISNEVYNLSLELSPQNKAALEAFMDQFFAPKTVTARIQPPAESAAGKAVAK